MLRERPGGHPFRLFRRTVSSVLRQSRTLRAHWSVAPRQPAKLVLPALKRAVWRRNLRATETQPLQPNRPAAALIARSNVAATPVTTSVRRARKPVLRHPFPRLLASCPAAKALPRIVSGYWPSSAH